MPTRNVRAFTLIELLVVITIIVVLMALLTPALDKAIYQAELATCGAQLKGVISETQLYTLDFKRHYPNRLNLQNQQTIEITEMGRGWDLRQIVKGYVRVNSLTCPLSGKVDIANSLASTTFIFGSYDYFADWRYFSDPGYKALARVGDKFTSVEDGSGAVRSFGLLASDREVIGVQAQVQSAHPDRDGILGQVVLQDGADPWGVVSIPGEYDTITIALWRNPGNHTRGTLDRNFGYQDGSILRLSDLAIKPDGLPANERMVIAPHYSDSAAYQNSSTGAANTYYTALPRE